MMLIIVGILIIAADAKIEKYLLNGKKIPRIRRLSYSHQIPKFRDMPAISNKIPMIRNMPKSNKIPMIRNMPKSNKIPMISNMPKRKQMSNNSREVCLGGIEDDIGNTKVVELEPVVLFADEWSSREVISGCTEKCGFGVVKISQKIAANGSVKEMEDEIPCIRQVCPRVDGGWSRWSEWSECLFNSCEDGETKFRSRRCDNPEPQEGGRHCRGEDVEFAPCIVGCEDVVESKLLNVEPSCLGEVENGISWPASAWNTTHHRNCPENKTGVILRKCNSEGDWMTPDYSNCSNPVVNDIDANFEQGKYYEDWTLAIGRQRIVEDECGLLSIFSPFEMEKCLNVSRKIFLLKLDENPKILPSLISQYLKAIISIESISLSHTYYFNYIFHKEGLDSHSTYESLHFVGTAAARMPHNEEGHCEFYSRKTLKICYFTGGQVAISSNPDVDSVHESFTAVKNLYSSIEIAKSAFKDSTSPVRFTVIFQSGLVKAIAENYISGKAMPKSFLINSDVVGVWFTSVRIPVKLTLKVYLANHRSHCGMLDESKNVWRRANCSLVEAEGGFICNCHKGGIYAIISDLSTKTTRKGGDGLIPRLDVLGVCSLLFLLVNMANLLLIKVQSERVYCQLMMSLCAAVVNMMIVIISTDMISKKFVCIISSICLHYFSLCLSAWTICLGLCSLRKCRDVEDLSQSIRVKSDYASIGMALPTIPVVTTFMLVSQNYANENYCWIENRSSIIWSFTCPVAAFATTVLVLFLWLLRRLRGEGPEDRAQFKHKILMRNLLYDLLGVLVFHTWLAAIPGSLQDRWDTQNTVMGVLSAVSALTYLLVCQRAAPEEDYSRPEEKCQLMKYNRIDDNGIRLTGDAVVRSRWMERENVPLVMTEGIEGRLEYHNPE